MDAAWFHNALDRAGTSQADLARHLRLSASAVSRMLSGRREVKLLELSQIASFLGVSPEEVRRHAEDGGAPASVDLPRLGRGRPPAALRAALRAAPMHALPGNAPGSVAGDGLAEQAPASFRGTDLVPIRSAGRGGNDQRMFLEDGPIGYTPRPANLGGVRGAYAIYMVGDSMEPRYEPGWLLHINPFKPPTRGRDIVVYKAGDAVLIKQFVGWDGDALVLRQLNPPQTLRVPRADVIECHLVVGVDQEG